MSTSGIADTSTIHDKRNVFMDVLRSIAIIAVINCHWGSMFSSGTTQQLLGLGGRGVDLFFVLSGWLLGRQLLQELSRTGSIEIGRFWLRRWMRTLPAYYAMLAFTYLWQMLSRGNYHLDLTYLCFAQTYFSEMPYFGVSWSLCVEEHFYLMIAPLLLLVNRRWGVLILGVCMLLPGIFRTWNTMEIAYEQTHYRWDQCGAGVILAYTSIYLPKWWRYLCSHAITLAVCSIGLVLLNLYWRVYPHENLRGWNLTMWSSISVIWVLLANSSIFWQQHAGSMVTRFIADRSYSLYLVHVESLVIVRKLELTGFTSWVMCWLISFLAAELLFRMVERPWMKLRERVCSNRDRSDSCDVRESNQNNMLIVSST